MNKTNRLRAGRTWHVKMQSEWSKEEGKDLLRTAVEKRIIKGNRRPGRIDFLLEDHDMIIVLEFKHSDWDKMKSTKHVLRNIRRYTRQLWNYLESEEIDPELTPHKKWVQIALIFPMKPEDRERLEIVENVCDERWVSVVWVDEDIETLRK